MKIKRLTIFSGWVSVLVFLLVVSGCGKPKEPTIEERLLGSWSRFQNKAYIMLMIKANGGWTSDVRVEGGTSRIIEKKGKASGTWLVEERSLIFTVTESDIEETWALGKTLFCEMVDLNDEALILKYPNGRVLTWKRSKVRKRQAASPEMAFQELKIPPIVANLNKLRSNDKDRYICLDITLNLRDLLPDEEIPLLHPKAKEAVLLYLSSLFYNDVKTFDKVKEQMERIKDILNPYLGNMVKEVKVNYVVIVQSMAKVEEFLVEHSAKSGMETEPEAAENETQDPKKDEG